MTPGDARGWHISPRWGFGGWAREWLDRDLIRRHLVEMMGGDDERVAGWDAIVEESGEGQ